MWSMVQWISQVNRWLLVAAEVCVYVRVCLCVLGVITPDYSIISLFSPATLLHQPCMGKALFPGCQKVKTAADLEGGVSSVNWSKRQLPFIWHIFSSFNETVVETITVCSLQTCLGVRKIENVLCLNYPIPPQIPSKLVPEHQLRPPPQRVANVPQPNAQLCFIYRGLVFNFTSSAVGCTRA